MPNKSWKVRRKRQYVVFPTGAKIFPVVFRSLDNNSGLDFDVSPDVKHPSLRSKPFQEELTSCVSYWPHPAQAPSVPAAPTLADSGGDSFSSPPSSSALASDHITHHRQTRCRLDILVPVRGLEITSCPIAQPTAGTPCLRKWSMGGAFLYANFMQPPWQLLITLLFSTEPLNLFDVNHFVRSYNRISQLSSAVASRATHGTSGAASFLPSLRCRLFGPWSSHVACTFLQCPSVMLFKLSVAVEVTLASGLDTTKISEYLALVAPELQSIQIVHKTYTKKNSLGY